MLATDHKTIIAYMSEGAYFGEVGLFIKGKRTVSVRSKSVCIFFTIQKEDLFEVIQDYPLHEKFLRAVAK